jgi:hypothetical protein
LTIRAAQGEYVLMESNDANSGSVVAVAESIRRYLRVRPRAADTVDGIHQWWVDWGDLEQSPAITEIALQLLQARGEMEPVDIGGRQVWRACGRTGLAEG